MELDSFSYNLFFFSVLARKQMTVYPWPFRVVFMFSEPEKMSNKSRFPFFPGSSSERCYSIAIGLAWKVCCVMKCVEIAADLRVVCIERERLCLACRRYRVRISADKPTILTDVLLNLCDCWDSTLTQASIASSPVISSPHSIVSNNLTPNNCCSWCNGVESSQGRNPQSVGLTRCVGVHIACDRPKGVNGLNRNGLR